MTLLNKDRDLLIKYLLEKSNKAIEDVNFLIENNKFYIAVNRIYYGIFYALSGLALKYKFSTSKHTQLIGWFNKNFIKENKIDKKFSKYIQEAFEKRLKGDYEIFYKFSREEVIDLFIKMKKTIKEIKKLIHI